MKLAFRTIILGMALAAWADNRALAADAYWTNAVSGGNYFYSEAGNWSPSGPPTGAGDFTWFTNGISGGLTYTVHFTNNQAFAQSGRIRNDSPTFDLGGFAWNHSLASYTAGLVLSNATVTISSSGNGGLARFVGGMNAASTFLLNDSMNPGHGPEVDWWLNTGLDPGMGTIVVSGPGSTLLMDSAGGPSGGNAYSPQLTVSNGATYVASSANGYGMGPAAVTSTALFNNATYRFSSTGFSYYGGFRSPTGITTTLIFTNGSRWFDVGISQITDDGGATTVLLDGSTGVITRLGFSANLTGNTPTPANSGTLLLRHGSSLTVSNYIVIAANTPAAKTNLFLMDGSSTLLLGGGSQNGVLTNYGLLKAAGTITGQGSGRATILNGYDAAHSRAGRLEIGNSIGTLTLRNADLTSASNSVTYFQFNELGSSQILTTNGFVHLLGTNQFALAPGAAPLSPHAKYGVGTYDFVISPDSNINQFAQYDGLVALLTNNNNFIYGVDFQYGVVNLGGGLFALQLTFVPEPSTLLLVGLGGLLVYRRRALRRRRE